MHAHPLSACDTLSAAPFSANNNKLRCEAPKLRLWGALLCVVGCLLFWRCCWRNEGIIFFISLRNNHTRAKMINDSRGALYKLHFSLFLSVRSRKKVGELKLLLLLLLFPPGWRLFTFRPARTRTRLSGQMRPFN